MQTIAAGADLVTFSGDKLFGGPQAGIIVGRADLVDRCRRHPLARALRPGGLVLGALQNTVLAYLDRDAERIPFWAMVARPVDELRRARGRHRPARRSSRRVRPGRWKRCRARARRPASPCRRSAWRCAGDHVERRCAPTRRPVIAQRP